MLNEIKNVTLIMASTCLFACNGAKNDKSNDIHLEDSLVSQENTNASEDNIQEEGVPVELVGTYTGTLPCAGCEGIKATVTINEDGSFKKSDQYLTKNKEGKTLFEDKGMIDWNSKDSIVTLISTVDTTKLKYKMGENVIKALNIDGKTVKGVLADDFTLTKK